LENLSKNLDRYRDEATSQAETGGGRSFELRPGGISSGPSLPLSDGVNLFGTLSPQKSIRSGGFGSANSFNLTPGGASAMDGGGPLIPFSGVTLFIATNVILVGGGVLVYLLIRFRKRKSK
jgi:hypothetical protein